jgi:hypothetical protein
MKEIKPNQLHPSEELLEKIQHIAFRKSMVSLAYRGEFNKFGVYVQSKDIHEQGFTKTTYMAGGKFIPKLIFMEVTKALPLEAPQDIFEDIDLDDPEYEKKTQQRYDNYLKEGGFFKPEIIVNKYEPGDWEKKIDLLYKFTLELEEKYVGQDYP